MRDAKLIAVVRHRINQHKVALLEAEIAHAKSEIAYIQSVKKMEDELSSFKNKLFLEEMKDAGRKKKSAA